MSHTNLVSQYNQYNGTQILPFTCHSTERFSRIEDVLNAHSVMCATIHEAEDGTLSVEFRPDLDTTFVRSRDRFSFTTPAELKQVILKNYFSHSHIFPRTMEYCVDAPTTYGDATMRHS